MIEYEYRVTGNTDEEFLNKKGGQGWRLVAVNQQPGYSPQLFWERPKKPARTFIKDDHGVLWETVDTNETS